MLRIPQRSSVSGTSPSDCLVSYPRHSLGGSYPSAEMQSGYSTAPASWARERERERERERGIEKQSNPKINVKESQRYNVLVQMNHQQDLEDGIE